MNAAVKQKETTLQIKQLWDSPTGMTCATETAIRVSDCSTADSAVPVG